MDHVQFILKMVQPVRHLISTVSIGSIPMESKIIHSTVICLCISLFHYELYFIAWTNDPSKAVIVAFSPVATFQTRLPAGNDQTSALHLLVRIRDTRECITEWNMTSIYVAFDSAELNDLINDLDSSSTSRINENPTIRLLSSGNQNTVSQVINSLSQSFNKKTSENIDAAIRGQLETLI